MYRVHGSLVTFCWGKSSGRLLFIDIYNFKEKKKYCWLQDLGFCAGAMVYPCGFEVLLFHVKSFVLACTN